MYHEIMRAARSYQNDSNHAGSFRSFYAHQQHPDICTLVLQKTARTQQPFDQQG